MSSSELSQPPVPYGVRLRNKAAKWRENPERLAWIIMLVSFACFCMLLVLIPMAVAYTMRYASLSQEARLSVTTGMTGKVALYIAEDAEALFVFDPRDNIREGMRIVSRDGAAQGTVEFKSDTPDNAELGSVQFFSDTDLKIERIRRPLFASSSEPYYVRLNLKAGQARVLSNSSDGRPLHVDLVTPHGLVSMDGGSYQVTVLEANPSVSETQTIVNVRSGTAELIQGRTDRLLLNENQSAWLRHGAMAEQPQSSGQNLIVNGGFVPPVLDTWQSNVADNVLFPGNVQFDRDEGRRVAFFSQGNANGHSDIGITQPISLDLDLQTLDSLVLQMDVKILFQSISGAGQLSTEYPVRAQIEFISVYGQTINWGHGFYYRKVEPNVPFPPPPEAVSTLINQGEWYTYVSNNIIEELKQQGTPPARINSIRIYASGHNYQSMVSEIDLRTQ